MCYDKEMEQQCLDAYDNGERTTLREVIQQLREQANQ